MNEAYILYIYQIKNVNQRQTKNEYLVYLTIFQAWFERLIDCAYQVNELEINQKCNEKLEMVTTGCGTMVPNTRDLEVYYWNNQKTVGKPALDIPKYILYKLQN
ncbi:hypothetical protein PHYBLDRAFT_173087 [Phycomyces blakesleeanus NRRL 1555(-)]|uniref:Uncharacterized protein n=1 Tax=Phycomyces blakesleeanus (strain ATCC 8743b / DSM 1359 / FGSC 10004 / NBRC 33097 / NRRL 1555) TaxID=763407 RepID=A0A167KQX2_PHYB8|nr:hypothetical protein PHYBLDRAFT_173087 [Phycomyces blakesleeanus NRRL 1555(-)]OAD68667.1 hypothetical protein PHYBLDRAFT_173087 [Phycomyces blakesleeanus NRRL 1555(-)]|eukprot:XP_018286707.1 hypothetical protein PHYBLDRAFT_173087 [Phycomyces blakesleeanus NRRL 1555(-)]